MKCINNSKDTPESIGKLGGKTVRGILGSILGRSEIGILIPLIILVVITSILRPNFLTEGNITAVVRGLAFVGIVAIGQTMVILLGEIDISVGQVAGLGAILSSSFMILNVPIILSIIIAVILCGIIGFINGFLVSYVKLSAFITTIGMLYIVKGIKLAITNGYPIYPLPKAFNDFGLAKPLGISWAFVICIVMFLIFGIILGRTVYGRKIYAVGDNKDVARLAGIRVEIIKVSAFVLCSMIAAFSGILLSAQIQSAVHTIGDGWELVVIAATAIGGISLAGGAGSIYGTLIGVLILQVLTNSIVLLGVNTQYQTIVIGVVMILAVFMDIMKRKSRVKA